MNFKDLGLSEDTIKAIDDFGITEPTSVQSDVIPSILQGRDIFTIAPARCGKTMSYVLPLLDIIHAKKAKNILETSTPHKNHTVSHFLQTRICDKRSFTFSFVPIPSEKAVALPQATAKASAFSKSRYFVKP